MRMWKSTRGDLPANVTRRNTLSTSLPFMLPLLFEGLFSLSKEKVRKSSLSAIQINQTTKTCVRSECTTGVYEFNKRWVKRIYAIYPFQRVPMNSVTSLGCQFKSGRTTNYRNDIPSLLPSLIQSVAWGDPLLWFMLRPLTEKYLVTTVKTRGGSSTTGTLSSEIPTVLRNVRTHMSFGLNYDYYLGRCNNARLLLWYMKLKT